MPQKSRAAQGAAVIASRHYPTYSDILRMGSPKATSFPSGHDWDVTIYRCLGATYAYDPAMAAPVIRTHRLGPESRDQGLFSLWQHIGVYPDGHSNGGTKATLAHLTMRGAYDSMRNVSFDRDGFGSEGGPATPTLDVTSLSVDALLAEAQDRLVLDACSTSSEPLSWASVVPRYEKAIANRDHSRMKDARA
jgi:hypothetical protein